MTNVIQFPERPVSIPAIPSSFRSAREEQFLRECRETLCDEDYEELLEAIADLAAFEQADPDIQVLTSSYFGL